MQEILYNWKHRLAVFKMLSDLLLSLVNNPQNNKDQFKLIMWILSDLKKKFRVQPSYVAEQVAAFHKVGFSDNSCMNNWFHPALL